MPCVTETDMIRRSDLVNNQVQKTNAHTKRFVVKNLFRTKKWILFSQFCYKMGEIKILISVNQFMKLLFCILHFCILGQT